MNTTHHFCMSVALLIALTGCGSGDHDNALGRSTTAKASIVVTSPDADPENDLIDLSGPWLTWGGAPTAVSYLSLIHI